MKSSQWDSLGVKATVDVYETVEEADSAAGTPDAALAECNKNLTYRGPLADFREQFVGFVEEETGISRKMKQGKDSKGKLRTTKVEKEVDGKKVTEEVPLMVPDETEGDYITRVRAERGLMEQEAWSAFAQPLADKVGTYEEKDGQVIRTGNLAVDIKEPERKARGPVKLAEKFRLAAENIIKKGTAKVTEWLEKLRAEGFAVADPTGDAAKDAQNLGWAIKAREDKKQKAALEAEYQ